jgi:hypothetical protein
LHGAIDDPVTIAIVAFVCQIDADVDQGSGHEGNALNQVEIERLRRCVIVIVASIVNKAPPEGGAALTHVSQAAGRIRGDQCRRIPAAQIGRPLWPEFIAA